MLLGPLGEVEADESVVGLMALYIQAGQHFAFYWGQAYLGSLEAYLVAAAFVLAGPSNLVLKVVPGLSYLTFVLLLFFGARRDLGDRVALLSALYLAVPPSFLAIWSLKARGGYMELLALGQALIFLAPWMARPGASLVWKIGLAGLLCGLLLWTHVLGLVYMLPVGFYLLLRLGRRLQGLPLIAGLLGALLGLAPALAYNLQSDWQTFGSLSGDGLTLQTIQDNLHSLANIGLPVMAGLGQATSSPPLFAESWEQWPANWPWAPPLLLGLAAAALLPSFPALLAASRGRAAEGQATAYFCLWVILLTPPLVSLGRFGELVAEPRYALPLYSATPVFAFALVRLADSLAGSVKVAWSAKALTTNSVRAGAIVRNAPRLVGTHSSSRALFLAVFAALMLALNCYSLLTADARYSLPTNAAGSTEANRAELLSYLASRGIAEIYTDYWLAYPLMFESREAVQASVISGGYNRFAPHAHAVATSDRPAFVFIWSLDEEAAFIRRLEALGGRGIRDEVSIYSVYTNVEPLDSLRP